MLVRCLSGLLGAVWVLSVASEARAQCTKDIDCKGDRVCDAGKCVSPPPPAAPPAAPPPASAPPAASPPAQGAPSQPRQKALGFSNLVFRIDRGDEIGIANENFRIHILEDLRRRGFNAVGAENLVFESDRGNTADLVLGGTVNELECKPGESITQVSCRIGVEWQVLDTASDSIIYKVVTRSAVRNAYKEPVASLGRQLILSNLSSLASRPKFRGLLAPDAPSTAAPASGFASASVRGCNVPARSMPAASEQVLDATVLVQTSGGFGSGFLVSTDGFVVTAAHVVSGATATIKLRDGRELAGTVIRSDRRLDIALLRLAVPAGTTLPCLPVKLDPVAVGSDAYAVGSPARRELSFSLARGIVSGVRVLDGVQYLQTDAAVNRGNSGGALVNASGEAVAVVSSKLVGVSVEGVAFGVPLSAGMAAIAVRPVSGATSPELMAAQAMVPTAGVRQALVDRPDAIPELVDDSAPPRRRNSTGMMAGGIVMTSLAPVAFLVALVAEAQQTSCETVRYGYDYTYSSGNCSDYDSTIYGGVFSGIILAGVGIPLIVVGGKKVADKPATTARIAPWANPRAAGVGLRIDM